MEAGHVVRRLIVFISYRPTDLITKSSRSPGDRVPWWVLIWIKRSPLVFLVMSVACFSVGLCLFAYASHQVSLPFLVPMKSTPVLPLTQSYITSTLTTVLTALTSFGLCAVSAWFATERWIFMRYRGRKWLDDVLTEITDAMLQNRFIDGSRHGVEKIGSGLLLANSTVIHAFGVIQVRLGRIFHLCSCVRSRPDDTESALPVSNEHVEPNVSNHNFNFNDGSVNTTNVHDRKSSETVLGSLVLQTNVGSSVGSPHPLSIASQEKSPTSDSFRPISMPFPTNKPANTGLQRFRNIARAARAQAAAAANGDQSTSLSAVGSPREPMRRPTTSSSMTDKDKKKGAITTKASVTKSRLASLVPKLKVLEVTQDLAAHSALVKDLQFSPDGKYFATSRFGCAP